MPFLFGIPMIVSSTVAIGDYGLELMRVAVLDFEVQGICQIYQYTVPVGPALFGSLYFQIQVGKLHVLTFTA